MEELEKMIKQLVLQQNRNKYLTQMNFSYNNYTQTQIDYILAVCSTLVKQDEFALDIILKISETINLQYNGKEIALIINKFHYKQKFISKLFQILKQNNSQEQLDKMISDNISPNTKYLMYIYLNHQSNATEQFFNTLFVNKFNYKIDAFLDMLIKTFLLLSLQKQLPNDILIYIYRTYVKKYIVLSPQQSIKISRLSYQLLYILLLQKRNILEYEDQIFLKQLINQKVSHQQIYLYAWMCLVVTYINYSYENNELKIQLKVDDWEDENDILLMLNNGIDKIFSLIIEKQYQISSSDYYEILQHYKMLLQISFDKNSQSIINQIIASSSCIQINSDKQVQQIQEILKILHKNSPIYVNVQEAEVQFASFDIYHLYFTLYTIYVLNSNQLTDQNSVLTLMDKFQTDTFIFVKILLLLDPDNSFCQYLQQLHVQNQQLFYDVAINLTDQQFNTIYDILCNDLHNYLQGIQLDANLTSILQIWCKYSHMLQTTDTEVILTMVEMFLIQLVRQMNIHVLNKEQQMVLLIFLRFLEKLSQSNVEYNYYLILVNLTDLYVLQFKETRYIISNILHNILYSQKDTMQENNLEYKLSQHFLQMLESGVQAIRQISSQSLSTLLKYKTNQVLVPILYQFKYQHNKYVKLGILKAFTNARICNQLAIYLVNFSIQQNDINFREQGLKFIIQQNLGNLESEYYFHYLNLVHIALCDLYFNKLTLEYFGVAGNYKLHSYKSLQLINYLQIGLLTPKITIAKHYQKCLSMLQAQHDFLLSKYGVNYQQLMLAKHDKMKYLKRQDAKLKTIEDFKQKYYIDFNVSEFEI